MLKFTVEVIDVFNNFAAAVFIAVVVDGDDNDGDDNDDENDKDDDEYDDDVTAVARLCCSMVISWEENAPSPFPEVEKE